MPEISIITICYNEKNIERTCESIVNQTYQDFEWIVVDGGSTDGTLDILNKYKDRINTLISEKDNGLYNAMNKGIKLAKGKWLNFMNGGDCFYENETLEKVFLNRKYKADVLYGICVDFDENRIFWKEIPEKLMVGYFLNDCLNHQASFIKKSLFDKYGLYSEDYKICADLEKWVYFVKNKCKFQFLNQHVAKYDITGISSVNIVLREDERKKVFEKYFSAKEIKKIKRKLKLIEDVEYKFFERIFSVKNYDKHKILTILGIKFKLKRNKKSFEQLKNNILYIPPYGIGDGLMFTAFAKKIYKQTGKKVFVSHKNNEIYKNNPYIEAIDGYFDTTWTNEKEKYFLKNKIKPAYITYWEFEKLQRGFYNFKFPSCHAIVKMAENAGVSGEIEIRPEIYLTDEEKLFGRFVDKNKKQIAIMSTAVDRNKQWDKWQELVYKLKDKYDFVQLGSNQDELIDGVIDKRGLTIRNAASILYNSDLFVGQIGGLMHLARAVETQAVIVYSSAEPDYFINYICNKNIKPKNPCSLCAENKFNSFLNSCNIGYQCVNTIDLEDVIDAIEKSLINSKDKLEVEKVIVKGKEELNFESYWKRNNCF